jgi:hypothetical protein
MYLFLMQFFSLAAMQNLYFAEKFNVMGMYTLRIMHKVHSRPMIQTEAYRE